MSAGVAFDTGRYPAVERPVRQTDRVTDAMRRIAGQLDLDGFVVSSDQGVAIWDVGGPCTASIAAIAPLWVDIRDSYGEQGLARLKRRFGGTWIDHLSVRRLERQTETYYLSAVAQSIPSRSLALHQVETQLERLEFGDKSGIQ